MITKTETENVEMTQNTSPEKSLENSPSEIDIEEALETAFEESSSEPVVEKALEAASEKSPSEIAIDKAKEIAKGDKSLVADIERGALALEQRKKVPKTVFGQAHLEDERTKMVDMYRQDKLIPEDAVPYFGDAKKRSIDIGRGMQVVIDPTTRIQANHLGDPLYWLPKKDHDEYLQRSAEESSKRMQEKTKESEEMEELASKEEGLEVEQETTITEKTR